MFIKKVIKTYKSTGKSYIEYRFVRGYRSSAGPRHQTLLTVRDIPLPETQWKLLADTVEAMLHNEQVLLVAETVEALARHYCNMILAKHPEFGQHDSSQGQPGQRMKWFIEARFISSMTVLLGRNIWDILCISAWDLTTCSGSLA